MVANAECSSTYIKLASTGGLWLKNGPKTFWPALGSLGYTDNGLTRRQPKNLDNNQQPDCLDGNRHSTKLRLTKQTLRHLTKSMSEQPNFLTMVWSLQHPERVIPKYPSLTPNTKPYRHSPPIKPITDKGDIVHPKKSYQSTNHKLQFSTAYSQLLQHSLIHNYQREQLWDWNFPMSRFPHTKYSLLTPPPWYRIQPPRIKRRVSFERGAWWFRTMPFWDCVCLSSRG